MGGIDINAVQLIMYLTKDLPNRLLRAADEISVRNTSFQRAVSILPRVDLRSKASNSGWSPAFLAGYNKKPPPLQSSVGHDEGRFCHRCQSKGHLAQICLAPAPAPGAYAALKKYLSFPKKKLNKHMQRDASAGNVLLLVS